LLFFYRGIPKGFDMKFVHPDYLLYLSSLINKMRFSGIILVSVIILGLSACVLEHNPVPPAMAFLTGGAYTPGSATIDTAAPILIGFTATRSNSNMVYLQVARAIDTLNPVVLNAYILIAPETAAINRTFSFTSGVYHTDKKETYTFKISDASGFTFAKSISFTVHPH
jgi:hypothetical protein